MTTDKNPAYAPPFTAAYRRLYGPLRPSEQLLAATRRLYRQAAPSRSRFWRARPWIAATLCAACLLLAFGWHFLPQPDKIAPPYEMQLRTASQLPAPDDTAGSGSENNAGQMLKNRMAAAPAAETQSETKTEQQNDIALLSESGSDAPLICNLPLADSANQLPEYAKPPAEYARQSDQALQPCFVANIVRTAVFNALQWLGLW